MENTIMVGDFLLVNKFIYGIRLPFTGKVLIPIKDPHRGDVVVFRFPKDRSIDYIKRVIGTPGDTVQIKNKKVYINGEPISDPHANFSAAKILSGDASPRDNFGPVLVPAGRIFVMGDNRDNSYDSRFWGYVDQKDILGKAFILYWSWDIEKPLFSLDRLTSIRFGRLASLIE